jgi:hypothetical protein
MVVTMKIIVLWVVTRKIEGADSSETLVNIYQNSRPHTVKSRNLPVAYLLLTLGHAGSLTGTIRTAGLVYTAFSVAVRVK